MLNIEVNGQNPGMAIPESRQERGIRVGKITFDVAQNAVRITKSDFLKEHVRTAAF